MSEMLHKLDRAYTLVWHQNRPEEAIGGLEPDFEWIVPDHPDGAVRHGPDAVMADSAQLAIIGEGIHRYGREGVDTMLDFYTEDVVWEEDPKWPDGQVWHGRAGVRAALRERLDSTSIAVQLKGAVELGTSVLTLMRWTAEGLGSGAQAELHPAVIWEFRGRLIGRVRFFLDQERARREFEDG